MNEHHAMKKRQYYAIAAILLFFGLGASLDLGISKADHLKSYARRIERSLQKKEVEVESLLSDTGFIHRQLRGIEKLPSHQQESDLKRLLSLTSKPYNVTLYRGDSLVFWLNNNAFIGKEQADVFKEEGEVSQFMKLPNGYFQIVKKNLQDSLVMVALFPIKKQYARKSEFLSNKFITDDFEIPDDVILSETPTAFPIRNIKGEEIAWLDATGPAKDKLHLQIVFFIYLLGFFALGWLINDLAVMLVRRYKPWVGAAFILGAVAVVRWATIEMGFTNHFASFQTFSPIFTDKMLEGVGSLGELLINIVLLVWMMVFFNREFLVKEFTSTSLPIRFALTTLNFFAVIFGMLMVCGIFKSIVRDSDIVFDFENVFNLNSQSVLAMVGVVLLLLALFLFSHRMMLSIHKIGMSKRWRLPAMVVSLLGSLPVVNYTKLELPTALFLSAATIYLLFFEFFVESRRTNLGWMVSWLIIYSMFTSLLLYKYNDDKDYIRRTEYAKALASYKDPIAEEDLADLGVSLMGSSVLKQFERICKNSLSELPKEEVRDIVESRLGTYKYLLHNYEVKISGFFLKNGQIALTEQEQTWGEMEQLFQRTVPTNYPNLRFVPEKTRDPGYLIRLVLPCEPRLVIFLKFNREFSSPSKVYTELLLDKKYKNLKELDSYDYGIFQDGKQVDERNKSYGKQLTDELPPPGQIKVLTHTSRRSELLYHAPDNIAIKIGRDTGGYIKPLSLFSYVFTMLALAVLLFGVINYFINALPGPLNFLRSIKPSLRNQFQVWVIGMILFSFLGIGFITVWYFQQSSNEYHKGRLDRKVTSALASVAYEIKAWHRERQKEFEIEEKNTWHAEEKSSKSEHGKFESEVKEKGSKINIDASSLTSLIPLISEVHRLDVNIYDLNGNLISSSEEDIFRQGLISPKMGAHAYQVLTKLEFKRSDQDESIGDLNYLAAYVPLQNLEGKTLAFMGIPYYARQRELRSDVTDFMSTLLNVYVFLLLIAGGLAIFIANSITKALVNLSENLRRLRLRANQPLDYKRKDEIGDLVAAYNRAIQELDESSRLLAQSEREGAWREMAKQVAHEIKNPLTPMKLSIQYLLHAYQANSKNIEPLLHRVANTLVEQIESLAQIATEFSNFAKMPAAENIDFSLNDLAASVHHLFANERPDMQITLTMPDDRDFIVFADRNHLTRVLNNLFKNAIQAIPDNQHGVIELAIFQQEEKVIIKLSDNGSGIPSEIQEKVFVPNFSTKTSGTGLGLAICKSIIESFNGTIRFETEKNKGTTFFVELPLYQVQMVEQV